MDNNNVSVSNSNDDSVVISSGSKFINDNVSETKIYENNAKEAFNYTDDPSVKANLKTKKTFTISIDGKVFAIIIVILFIYILFLPKIYNFFN